MHWTRAVLPALVAASVTILLTPLVLRLALRLRAVDLPGGRKQHQGAIPRLGGLAIIGGIIAALVPSLFFFTIPRGRVPSAFEMVGFSVATLIILAVGLADDIRALEPSWKLFFQLIAASIVVGIGWQFNDIRLPWDARFSVGAVAPVLSLIWIVGVTNAINFIDGLDGLAAGIVAIIATSLMLLAILQGSPETVIATSCIVGACLGFLRHNWRPAKIYMGDSGSLTLGFVLASLSLHSSVKASATVAILVPMLALGLPVFDTLLVMWYRFLRGHQTMNRVVGVFKGDRKHLHHLLLETHSERSKVMLTLYGLAVAFCVMALVVAASGSLALGVSFLAVEFIAVLLIRKAGMSAGARRVADQQIQSLDAENEAAGGQEHGSGERPFESVNSPTK